MILWSLATANNTAFRPTFWNVDRSLLCQLQIIHSVGAPSFDCPESTTKQFLWTTSKFSYYELEGKGSLHFCHNVHNFIYLCHIPRAVGGGGGEALEESWYKVPGPGGGARTGGRKSGGSLGQVQCRHSNQAVVFSRPHSPTLHQLLLPLPFLPGWACATTLTHLPRAWHGRLMAPEGSRWRQRRAVATMQAANEKACHFLRLLF